jgi:hypothetical protein
MSTRDKANRIPRLDPAAHKKAVHYGRSFGRVVQSITMEFRTPLKDMHFGSDLTSLLRALSLGRHRETTRPNYELR